MMIVSSALVLLITAMPLTSLAPVPAQFVDVMATTTVSMKDATEQTTRDFLELADGLAELQLVRRSGHMQYGRCENLVDLRPRSWGWLSANGRMLRSNDVGQIRDVLADHGWIPHRAEGWRDGVLTFEHGWAVSAARHASTVDVVVIDGESSVELRVFGPCLPVTERERREYTDIGSWVLR